MAENEYLVTGMSCAHCERSVRDEVTRIAGVDEARVSAQTGRLVVSTSHDVPDGDVLAAVEQAGYRAERV